MSSRLLVALWLVIGVVVWNVIFDLYVSRGAREYLQLNAEARLAGEQLPSMDSIMRDSRNRGAVAATRWGLIVFCAGCTTVYVRRRR